MPGESLYVLKYVPDEQRYVIRKNSLSLAPEIIDMRQRWEAWLSTTTSFAFEDRQGNHSTIRRERLQRGETYWYAYRSIQGHTRKRYLGKTSGLTLEKLEAVSALFVEQQNGVPGQENSTTRSEGNFMPLLETKLHPPLLAGALIERTRLLKQLDASLTHRLTSGQAAAGAGHARRSGQPRPATELLNLPREEADQLPGAETRLVARGRQFDVDAGPEIELAKRHLPAPPHEP